MSSLLQAEQLSLRQGRTTRLQDLDLDLQRGEIVGLLGLNGAGKSTALALLAGTLAASGGRVLIEGQELRSNGRLRRHIGLLPQRPPIYPELTVRENLEYAGLLHGLSRKELRQAQQRISEQLDLTALADKTGRQLSTGMAIRLGLAMALIHQPAILLLDEPTAGLDPLQAEQLRRQIKQQADERAVLMSSHLLADIENLCGRALLLHEGRKISEEVLQNAALIWCEFSRAPDDRELLAIAGIAAIHRRDGNRLLLQLDDQAPPVMAEKVSGRGWGLRSWQAAGSRLNERFQALNTGQQA